MKKITCIFILSFIALSVNMGCLSTSKSGDTVTTITTITGSYNVNQTSCKFKSEKTFDDQGNIDGCVFDEICDGNVRPTDFIAYYDEDFNAKCINPAEELPVIEEEPTTPPSTISSSFRKK